MRRVLADLAFVRSGDKGDDCDVGVFARDGACYVVLVEQLTAERVAALLGDVVTDRVEVYEVPNVLALKVVLRGALGGGGPRSLRADNLGKALGGALLHLELDVPEHLGTMAAARAAPPADPYATSPWVTWKGLDLE